MAVVMNMRFAGVRTEDYDRVMEILDFGTRPAHGLLVHLCGATPDGLRVVDVWESEDDWNAFLTERLGPAVGEAGIAGAPDVELYPLHNAEAGDLEAMVRLGLAAGTPAR